MSKAFINGELLKWARERAAMPREQLAKKVGQKPDRVVDWETGKEQPTFKQALRLASVTNVPFGYLFLPQPPADELPLPDLRTVGSGPAEPLNSNTRDLLEDVLFKHGWFVDHLVQHGQDPLPFVAKFKITHNASEVAADIRKTLDLDGAAQASPNWESYLRLLIDHAESRGIWMMRSGIVGSNTHRPLSVRQFRGFAIADSFAPLVFINGKDALAAQIFTFAHEIAHIWFGSSGISNLDIGRKDYGTSRATEIACNRVAAEVVVPAEAFNQAWSENRSASDNYDFLSRFFKVSRVVIARRALDLGKVVESDYAMFYRREEARWEEESKSESEGGNFYNTLPMRNGTRFTRAVVSRAIAGDTLLRDAGTLLNMQPASVVKYFRKAIAK
ncbi:Zn-dependent peptidase ImmA (M78 family)/DNA-binding XRE family transcriptional regulator [Nitrobacteraceae bacterium AZCC 1564]